MSLVLAVDDSKPMLAMLSKCLADGGHNVIKAVDGVEALMQLRKHKPDMVIRSEHAQHGRSGIYRSRPSGRRRARATDPVADN